MKVRVISLGGSLISPSFGKIDEKLIKKIKKLIEKFDEKFIIVCGGGKLSRLYQSVGRKFKVSNKDLDLIGIAATRLNAELIRSIFKVKIIGINKKERLKSKVYVSCGFEPGHSTDYNSVVLANIYGCKEVINLTNVDYVYDRDPNIPGAKPIKRITLEDYLKLVGEEWIPGKNVPFDPIAAKLSKKLGIKVVILNGKKIKNLENFLRGKEFIGTLIE